MTIVIAEARPAACDRENSRERDIARYRGRDTMARVLLQVRIYATSLAKSPFRQLTLDDTLDDDDCKDDARGSGALWQDSTTHDPTLFYFF